MKVCEKCGTLIGTKDGENKCADCERGRNRKIASKLRREREQALSDLGLTKVRGALGGTYWE